MASTIMQNTTARFYFKACAKCQGDMYLERDAYGWFRQCLQCGRIVELAAALLPVAAGKDKSQRLAA